MLVWFSSLSRRWSKLHSKRFSKLFNNKHKPVLHILPCFPRWLLSVGFFLAPERAEINNTNLILEMPSEKLHLRAYSSHAMSPTAPGSGTQGTALAHPWLCTSRHEHPGTQALLVITVSLASNLEGGKVYNNVCIIAFSLGYLKGRLKLFSGLRIIFLYCCKA